jgi:hypothetical protein
MVFFGGGVLRVATQRCNLMVPADWGWGHCNKKEDSSGSEPYKSREGNDDDNNGNGKDGGEEEDGNENDGRNQKIARPSIELIVKKEPMQPTFLKILPKQIQSLLALKTKKNNKRKFVSYHNNESDDYIINCVKTYHGKLRMFQGLMQSIKIDSSLSPQFLLVPFF